MSENLHPCVFNIIFTSVAPNLSGSITLYAQSHNQIIFLKFWIFIFFEIKLKIYHELRNIGRTKFLVGLDDGNRWKPNFASYEVGLVDDKLELDCESAGYPIPDVTWTLNSKPIKPDPANGIFIRNNGQTLVVSNLTPHWNGEISCRAINSAGEEKFSTELEIFQIPYITAKTQGPLDFVEGDTIRIVFYYVTKHKHNVTFYNVYISLCYHDVILLSPLRNSFLQLSYTMQQLSNFE